MNILVDQQLWSKLLGYLAEDTVFYDGCSFRSLALRWPHRQGPIDSYLCLRCVSRRLCGVVTGPPLLEALEYAISYGHFKEDCRRYRCILDSGWIHQVYPCHSLADAIRRTVGISGGSDPVHRSYVYPVLLGEVLCMGEKIPLGMQRGFYMRYCLVDGRPNSARWEIQTRWGLCTFKLVFGQFTGHGSGRFHIKRW